MALRLKALQALDARARSSRNETMAALNAELAGEADGARCERVSAAVCGAGALGSGARGSRRGVADRGAARAAAECVDRVSSTACATIAASTSAKAGATAWRMARDLMLQLALNPALGKRAARAHSRGDRQPSRAERAFLHLWRKRAAGAADHLHGAAQRVHRSGMDGLVRASSRAQASWSGTWYATQAGLARRHNVNAFAVGDLRQCRQLSENTAYDALLPGAEAAIRALP